MQSKSNNEKRRDRRAPLGLSLRAVGWLVLLLQLWMLAGPAPARAEENKILSVTKDAVYGAAAGLFLGGVLALVAEAGHRADTVRWGVVIGTFGGFAYGVVDVTRRSKGEFSGLVPRASCPALACAQATPAHRFSAPSEPVLGLKEARLVLRPVRATILPTTPESGRISW